MVLQLLDLVLLALTFFIGVLVARGLANSHYQKQLQQEKANWSAEQQLDSPATVLEGLTLGWLNLLLQALWPPVLEKHVANLTANLLQRILDEVLSKNMHKAPWKYINSILVEELSFGQVPPSFQAAVAKYDPGASMLSFSMDVHYRSSGAQAVMLVKSRSFGVLAPLSVRLEATHVQLKGRLHLGLLLGPEPPGIKGIYYSFTHPPDLDIAVRPLGMPLPPGLSRLTGALRGVLSNIINKRIVEPERRFFDLHQMYLDKHIARAGGPGGLLQIVIQRAKNLILPPTTAAKDTSAAATTATGSATPSSLPPSSPTRHSKRQSAAAIATGADSGSNSGQKHASYCQVSLGQQVLRTPIAHHAGTADAVWDWQLDFALPFELTAAGRAASSAAGAAPGMGKVTRSYGGAASSSLAVGNTSSSSLDGSGHVSPWPLTANAAISSAGCMLQDNMLTLSVCDAQTVGESTLLGRCKISLSSLQLMSNGPSRTLVLPLKRAASETAMLQLTVAWLQSTRPKPQPQPQPQQQQQQWLQAGISSSSASHSGPGAAGKAATTHQAQQQVASRLTPQSAAPAAPTGVAPSSSPLDSAAGTGLAAGSRTSSAPLAAETFGAAIADKQAAVQQQSQRQLPLKSVSWHDEKFRRALGMDSATTGGTTQQQSQQLPSQQQPQLQSEQADRMSRSLGSSPISKPPRPAPTHMGSGHRRAATADIASLSGAAAGGDYAPRAASTSTLPVSHLLASHQTEPCGRINSQAPLAAASAVGIRDGSGAAQLQTSELLQELRQQGPVADASPQQQPLRHEQTLIHASSWFRPLRPGSNYSWSAWLHGASSTSASPDRAKFSRTAATPAVAAAADRAVDRDAALVADKHKGLMSQTAAAAASEGLIGVLSNPFTMLSSIVQMQREVQQQQRQLQTLQQQLDSTSFRYQQLRRQCLEHATAVLTHGGQLLLHQADGTMQQVMMYLSSSNPIKKLQYASSVAGSAEQNSNHHRPADGNSSKIGQEATSNLSAATYASSMEPAMQMESPGTADGAHHNHNGSSIMQQIDINSHTGPPLQQEQQQHQQGDGLPEQAAEGYLVLATVPDHITTTGRRAARPGLGSAAGSAAALSHSVSSKLIGCSKQPSDPAAVDSSDAGVKSSSIGNKLLGRWQSKLLTKAVPEPHEPSQHVVMVITLGAILGLEGDNSSHIASAGAAGHASAAADSAAADATIDSSFTILVHCNNAIDASFAEHRGQVQHVVLEVPYASCRDRDEWLFALRTLLN